MAGYTSAELQFGSPMPARLDLLGPNLRDNVKKKQNSQQTFCFLLEEAL